MNQSELRLLSKYIAAWYRLVDGKVEVALSESGEYRFQGFSQINAHFQAWVVVLLDEAVAREWVARLLWLEELPVNSQARRGG